MMRPENERRKLKSTIAELRLFIGDRNDHHPNCVTHRGEECDCYAKRKTKAHESLDRIEDLLRELR
jgi:hypothetical protein